MKWMESFDERQRKEIEFARLYDEKFRHGTDGHNAKIIIAQMAVALDRIEKILLSEDHPDKLLRAEQAIGIFSTDSSQNEAG